MLSSIPDEGSFGLVPLLLIVTVGGSSENTSVKINSGQSLFSIFCKMFKKSVTMGNFPTKIFKGASFVIHHRPKAIILWA